MSQFEIWLCVNGLTKFATIGSMPKGPQGQKRPADVIGNAVKIAKIATQEVEDKISSEGKRKGGKKGGKVRAKTLTPEQRSDIARAAALARWKKYSD